MTLTLNTLRCPDTVLPQTRTVGSGEFAIGRGAENDWVLADPERSLSRRHCLLAFRSGGWQVADLSANGTFLNGEGEAIGHGQPRELRDGERLRLGAYEIELRIADAAAPRYASAPRADPFALDPFASRVTPQTGPLDQDPLLHRGSERDPFAPGLAPASINLPPDYDPLAPEGDEAPFAGQTQPDHSPHLDDAFRPAVAHALLPDDWDLEPTLQPQPAISPAPAAAEPAPISPVSYIPQPPPSPPPPNRRPPPPPPPPNPPARIRSLKSLNC